MDRRWEKPIVLRVEVPVSSWGLIIGKGGENLKKMQDQYNVKIHVPRPNAPAHDVVTVSGSPAACEDCEKAMQELVVSMSRGKDRQKKQSKPKPSGGSAGGLPAKCALCNSALDTVPQALKHLGSAGHVANMIEKDLSSPLLDESRLALADLARVLAEPVFRQFHEELGFDVDQLLQEIPKEEERQRAAEALNEQISRLSADFEWLTVDNRWIVRWDESPDGAIPKPMLEAPMLEDMLARCLLDAMPPLVRLPRLPVRLPRVDRKAGKTMVLKGQHKWPFEPTDRLSIVAALKLGLRVEDFDVMCGTSFIKALAGDGGRVKDDYYLQRYGRTLCCLHVPRRFHSQDDAGHAVEQLLCGSARNGYSFMAVTSLRIGSARVLVTSEVDASDADGNLVELKSAKPGNGFASKENGLQVAINGSTYVLGCKLDSDKVQLVDTEWIPAADLLKEAFVNQGQRVRLLLDRVLNHPAFDMAASETGASCVMKMTFDNIKAPVIEPADAGVAVLPQGM